MKWLFNGKKERKKERKSFWKDDFSDCSTLDYLPEYSVCTCNNNRQCRYVAMYAGVMLCGNPKHKSFIPEGSEPFDPYSGRFF